QVKAMSSDPLAEISYMIQSITGILLGADKAVLVKTRVLRRAHALSIRSLKEYLDYFRVNRRLEIVELVSVLTTHTTEFFREIEHFHFLSENVFPRLSERGRWRFWSAACSTGEEVYSLAIQCLEFLRQNPSISPQSIEFFGSDIDVNSIAAAKNGIYHLDRIKRLPLDIRHRYFDEGTFNNQEFVRVKDSVHALCHFRQANLISSDYPSGGFDVVFLRNVLIYFPAKTIEKIIENVSMSLNQAGLLFIGHSESLEGLKTEFKSFAHSVYCHKTILSDWEDSIVKKGAGNTSTLHLLQESEDLIENTAKHRDSSAAGTVVSLILIGASTGGVQALKQIFSQLPSICPPILIVQHIPINFSEKFAHSLNALSAVEVTEAIDGEILQNSRAYVAPGGQHMGLRQDGDKIRIKISQTPPINSHRPSVEHLFESALSLHTIRIAAALLTGMGADGAHALKKLRLAGHFTIAQSEKTCVVFGMPKVAIEIDAVMEILPLNSIGSRLIEVSSSERKMVAESLLKKIS
ncbi:MAG: hypothetical protein NTX25_10420, partial [Proteobacteria bacterium]|nr:hypothetical protein [Pseudomonadota bacterium]